MMRKWLLVAIAMCAPALGLSLAQSGKGRTFAFLVACGKYDKTQLNQVPFTVTEMKLFHDVLVQSGVPEKNIVFLHDDTKEPLRFLPTRENILTQLKLWVERLRPEDSLIVALSGHGVQFKGDKSGYFCPLDAVVDPTKKDKLLPMEGDSGLLPLIDKSKAGRKFVIVNACRNNPVSQPNLAKQQLDLRDEYNEEAPKGTVMLLACSQNQLSWFYDDKESRAKRRNRSLFMYHLTEAWKGSYAQGKKITVDHIVAEVVERVEADAPKDFNRNQMPIVKRKFDGQWELTAALARAKEITNSIGMKLVYIPPGKFLMGSPLEEKERNEEEGPQHEVHISKGVYMGVYEVTQEEYEKLMGNNPSCFSASGDGKQMVREVDTRRLPVENVSWDEAKEFCRKLSTKEGKSYRLPTEAEWEYACRAGTTTPFYFGGTISTDQANYDGNVVYANGQKGMHRMRTTIIGSFPANNFGLYDMHGNVWEWCEDWLDNEYYKRSPATDPLNTDKAQYHVLRGGSWHNWPRDCRSGYRCNYVPDFRDGFIGFRVVLLPP